jgi:hypothetical protein
MKNSSSPGGAQTQSILAAFPEAFLNECGAFDGTVTVAPIVTK